MQRSFPGNINVYVNQIGNGIKLFYASSLDINEDNLSAFCSAFERITSDHEYLRSLSMQLKLY